MDIQFYGANCVVLGNKQIRLVFDDNLAALGGKSVSRDGDICLFTGPHKAPAAKAKLVIDMPGEYEASGISVFGLQTQSHLDEPGQRSAVMYKVTWGETKVLVTGHVAPKFTEAQLEAIGIIDVMLVPVGGNGYTLDAGGALQIIKAVEPKIVIPTHYADEKMSFEVPQTDLQTALKNMAMEPKETISKFQFKPAEVTDTTQLVVLDTTI